VGNVKNGDISEKCGIKIVREGGRSARRVKSLVSVNLQVPLIMAMHRNFKRKIHRHKVTRNDKSEKFKRRGPGVLSVTIWVHGASNLGPVPVPGGKHLVSSRRLAAAMLASRVAKVSALDRPSRSAKEGTTGIPVINREQKERNLDLFFAGFGVLVGHLERAGWVAGWGSQTCQEGGEDPKSWAGFHTSDKV